MTTEELNKFLAEKSTPGAITYGDFKKYSVLSTLLICLMTNIPCDLETLAMETRFTEHELKGIIKSLVSEGTVTEEDHILVEGKLYKLKIEADNEKSGTS